MRKFNSLAALVCGLAFAASSAFAVEYQDTTAGRKPDAPSNVTFGLFDSYTTDLQTYWEPSPSSDVWGYVAYYSSDGGATWKDAGYARADATGRVAKGLGKYATYLYKVAAYNESGNSEWVQAEWNYGEAVKPGAIVFGAWDAEKKTLELSWGASCSLDLTYYPVEYSADGGKTWKSGGNVKYNRTAKTATGVAPGFLFRVCALDADGFRSPWVVGTFAGSAQ